MEESVRDSAASDDRPAVRTLLMSDLVSSTRLVEKLGDLRSAEVFHRHDRLARSLLEPHQGREIDKSDGFLLLFERPVDAVRYALAYHEGLAELSRELDVGLTSRVGIHLGEVILRDNPADDVARGAKPFEVEGLAKPTTARLMSLATGGQTLLTRGAFDVARRGAVGVISEDRVRWLAHGGYLMKGVEDPVEVFEVGEDGLAPLAAPPGSDKVRRVDSDEIPGWRPGAGIEVPGRSRWRLTHKLGESEFGEVWCAEHRKTRERRVLKFCFEASRLRRLQREITVFRLLRETLGERSDIARVLDWRFETAPFFVETEHTEGGTLSSWAESRGGLDAIPLDERLELVAQVAEALAAAHSVGVLHKDVRPETVLVYHGDDGQPRARLTDFGVGRLLDPARLDEAGITRLGLSDLHGSLADALPRSLEDSLPHSPDRPLIYLAPEILEGKPSTIQADVYAVGVLLYQMVTGDFTRALAPGWERDVGDELVRAEIAGAVDGSPAHRESDLHRLADRLRGLEARRLARGEAAGGSLRDRLQSRTALGTVLALAAVGAAVAAALAVQHRSLTGRLGRLADESATARRAARRAAQGVEETARAFTEVFADADLDTLSARQLLDLGAARASDASAWEDPLARARFLDTVGTIYLDRRELDRALGLLEEALALRRERLGNDHLDVALSLAKLAELHWIQGERSVAEPLDWQALEIRERLLGRDHPEIASSLNNLAVFYLESGDPEAAQPLLERSLAIQEEHLPEADGALGKAHVEMTRTLNNLAMARFERGDLAAAEPPLERSLALAEKLWGPDHPDVATRLCNLAELYENEGRTTAAEPLYRRALQTWEHHFGPDHPDVAYALAGLAGLLVKQGRLQEAEPLLHRALTVRESVLGPDHPLSAETRRRYSDLRDRLDRTTDS